VEDLKKLEIIKLIREIDYLESEYKYKAEILKQIDASFKEHVEEVLLLNEELKELFKNCNKIINDKRNFVIENNNQMHNDIESIVITKNKNPRIKTLYRTIAKATHPDKKIDIGLNEIYLEATKAYEDNELWPILSICDKLKLPYDIDDSEISLMKTEIDSIKNKTKFLESTYTWQWYIQQDFKDKSEIVLKFIETQIF
jgi:hypothetical protein